MTMNDAVKDAVNAMHGLEALDPEQDHGLAEEILCDYLRRTGAAELADAFDQAKKRCGFWYA